MKDSFKILKKSDYERIITSLNAKETQQKERDEKNREIQRLKELSQGQVSKWGNTLEGQRKAKLEAKKIRFEKEEELRRQEDIKEAIYQAEQRRNAIEHAKTLTFSRTDRVKEFHGALILTEVLKERDAQIELHKKRREDAQAREEERLRVVNEDLIERNAAALEAATRVRQEKKIVQKYHLEQIKKTRERALKEVEEWKAEGIEIEKNKLEWEKILREEKAKEDEKKLANFKWFHEDFLPGKEAQRALEKSQAATQEEAIKIFNEHKRRLAKLRKEKVAQKSAQSEKTSKKLLESLEQIIAEQNDEIEAQNQKRKEELENQENYIAGEKDLQKVRDLLHTVEYRKKQHAEVLQAREDRLEAERIEVREKMKGDREWKEQLREKEQRRRATNKEFQQNHLERINERAAFERHQRELDLACDHTINELNKLEERQFQSYAKDIIDEAIVKKRNPFPLRKAADAGAGGGRGPEFAGVGGLRPSYMACDQSGVQMPSYAIRKSTVETKKKITHSLPRSKKRLGFAVK